MSNHNRPRMTMPGPPPPLAPPPAPPAALPANIVALIESFPLPWCVGPNGYIWVAADVVKITNRDDIRLGDTPEGWRAVRIPPRIVIEEAFPTDLAETIVYAVNALKR